MAGDRSGATSRCPSRNATNPPNPPSRARSTGARPAGNPSRRSAVEIRMATAADSAATGWMVEEFRRRGGARAGKRCRFRTAWTGCEFSPARRRTQKRRSRLSIAGNPSSGFDGKARLGVECFGFIRNVSLAMAGGRFSEEKFDAIFHYVWKFREQPKRRGRHGKGDALSGFGPVAVSTIQSRLFQCASDSWMI